MTRQEPPGPNIDELDARIAEAAEWGDQKAEDFARRQKAWVRWRRQDRQKAERKGKE